MTVSKKKKIDYSIIIRQFNNAILNIRKTNFLFLPQKKTKKLKSHKKGWKKPGLIILLTTFILPFVYFAISYFSSPRRSDIKRIEKFLIYSTTKKNAGDFEIIPSGMLPELDENIDEFEEDIKKIES